MHWANLSPCRTRPLNSFEFHPAQWPLMYPNALMSPELMHDTAVSCFLRLRSPWWMESHCNCYHPYIPLVLKCMCVMKEAKLLKTKENAETYFIEYTIQRAEGDIRHLVSSVALGYNGRWAWPVLYPMPVLSYICHSSLDCLFVLHVSTSLMQKPPTKPYSFGVLQKFIAMQVLSLHGCQFL